MLNLAASVCIVLFGTMAGFFYAFSCTVMPGLDQTAPDQAVAAMQGINLAVRTPVFFVTFFLSPALGFIISALYYRGDQKMAAFYMAGASAIYLLFALVLTMQINVPMNEALAIISLDADRSAIWAEYSPEWTLWNHVRTAASALSALLACYALTVANKNAYS